jgi:hypothetical protein
MKHPERRGTTPPTEKAIAEAIAACVGFERLSKSIPSSSRACAFNASTLDSSSATCKQSPHQKHYCYDTCQEHQVTNDEVNLQALLLSLSNMEMNFRQIVQLC